MNTDIYTGNYQATYKGIPVRCATNAFGMVRMVSSGKPLKLVRLHTRRRKLTVVITNNRDPKLQPAECTCRPDGDACPACRDWHAIKAEEMPY